jgi:molybdopterin synthase catalytic subunit
MIAVAKRRGMITYGDLAAKMTSVQVEPHDPMLWDIIGDVAADGAKAGCGLLSVVVVHKHGDMEPGPGFFELVKYFGRSTADRTKCFVDELHKVHAQWSLRKP